LIEAIKNQQSPISEIAMHSDPEAIKKSARTYMMIGGALFAGTVITVAVNQVHLGVAAAVTVALIIASIKGSLVASVFMHLSHEKKWIYGALLLMLAFFIVLMSVPFFTLADGIGTPIHSATAAAHAPEPRH
jgi:cytochrome c oxidase subunit IV